MSDMVSKVTSIEELRNQCQPLVDIVGYEPGQFVTFRLRRVSLMDMCKAGKIPNALLQKATELFSAKSNKDEVDVSSILSRVGDLGSVSDIIDIMCDAAMVEPKFQDVKEYLTDNQKTEIFQWTQGGIKSLESFRAEQENSGFSGNE